MDIKRYNITNIISMIHNTKELPVSQSVCLYEEVKSLLSEEKETARDLKEQVDYLTGDIINLKGKLSEKDQKIQELEIGKIINSVKLILKFKYKLSEEDVNGYVDSMYVGDEWMNEIDKDTNIERWVDELVDCWRSEC